MDLVVEVSKRVSSANKNFIETSMLRAVPKQICPDSVIKIREKSRHQQDEQERV